jgi:hypothetical protein
MGDEGTRALAETLAQEVRIAAKSSDRALSSDFIQALMERTEKMRPYHTSMKLDRDAKRPLEVEAIFGNPLRSAIAQGIHVRDTLQHQIRDYEAGFSTLKGFAFYSEVISPSTVITSIALFDCGNYKVFRRRAILPVAHPIG